MNDNMFLEFERPVCELESKIRDMEAKKAEGGAAVEEELKALRTQCEELKKKIYSELTPWQRVQLARHPKRPYITDYIPRIFSDFLELHGDRFFADDTALLGGMAFLDKCPVMLLGHQKGRTVQEAMEQNFGMPHPEGYRKALRLMKLAERYEMPVLTFIDTAGAYPGIGAEERGQAEAIAVNLREMAGLKVPVIVTVLGEGGSGGALAIGVGDAILMLENAWYSVISPEGCASILFHDAAKAEVAAQALHLTAADLKSAGIIDEIIPEPLGGAQQDPDITAANIKGVLLRRLKGLRGLSTKKLLDGRYDKFRRMGTWLETVAAGAGPERKRRSPPTNGKKAAASEASPSFAEDRS
ncbi:MAG: acetyl-CoA carboxylase carboxyltransferase subunit alpha [Elusimicrobia bacterium]|nr:acetyl-CoA carboxylase carboxyltransferase subunit alpha [Candidatus Obscuribacterium magneticum]